MTFLDFLIGKAGLTAGAPVDRGIGFIGKTLLVELLEDPLCPVIVILITCADLPVPVIAEAEGFDLAAEVVYVLCRRLIGVCAGLYRIVLRRKSEGVEPHRMEDVVTVHPEISAVDISSRITFRVSDMESCT